MGMGSMHPDWDEWAQSLHQIRPQPQPKPQAPKPTPAQQLSEREQKRLQFMRWLREQGRLREDSCPDCGGTKIIGDGYPCPTCR